jgi:hypothetical protein
VNAASVIPGVSLCAAAFQRRRISARGGLIHKRDMSCGHEFTLGMHSKTGAFCSQLDRFK